MQFKEIELYEAIYDVRAAIREDGQQPGADSWTDDERKETLCRRIQARLPIGSPYTMNDMVKAWRAFRKSADDKAALTVEVARVHGWRCFWKGRGLGNCCDVVSLDRLVPGSRSGLYTVANCVIACRTHNTQRNDLTIEEFLASAGKDGAT